MKKITYIIISIALLLWGCTKSGIEDTGKIVIKVTDDPFNIQFVESATVTINKIEIRKTQEENNDLNPFIVLSEEPMTFDLLKLRNGVTAKMVDLEIPAWKYDLIRLYVSEAAMKIKEQSNQFTLKIPGGSQTGIKVFLNPAIEVNGGLSSELLLDFDLSRSFVMQGNLQHGSGINGFLFKPVIRASNISNSGRIEGLVTDETNAAVENAKIWIKKDTAGFATSFSDAAGKYAMIGIPSGSYTLYAWKPDFDTVKFEAIKVVEGNKTLRNITLSK